MSMPLAIYEGAAGFGGGYETAYDGPAIGADTVSAPPGGRPPSAPLTSPDVQVPTYQPEGIGIKHVLVAAAVLVGGYYAYKHLTKSDEELAANDDDDGDDYESNSSKSFMKPIHRNGSDDDDEEDDDEEDDDEEDDDEDDEDEDEDFAMNAKPEDSLTPNASNLFAAHRNKTQALLARIEKFKAENGA